MNCPKCGHAVNRPNAIFCGECGASLAGLAAVPAETAPVAPASGLVAPPMPPSVAAAKAATPSEAPPLLPPPPPPPPAATVAPPPPPPPPPLVVPPAPEAAAITRPPIAPDVAPPAILISAVPTFDQEATTTPPRSHSDFEPAVSAPTPPLPAAHADVEAEPDSDRTQLSTRRRAARWRLVLPDGRAIVVTTTTLVGRNPGSSPRFPGAKLAKVDDPAKSVSKTHAVLQSDSEGLWITDLGSTNGVILTQPDGIEVDLEAEAKTLVLAGATIDLGDFVMRVETD